MSPQDSPSNFLRPLAKICVQDAGRTPKKNHWPLLVSLSRRLSQVFLYFSQVFRYFGSIPVSRDPLISLTTILYTYIIG